MNTLTDTKNMPARAQGKYRTESSRWNAVIQRDPEADGRFYYAVRTTGVYCRPSCAARTPRRENVEFYNSGAEAGRAGFRPCKRCQPNSPALSEQHSAKIAAACRMIEAADETPSLDTLARSVGMSRFHFHRIFSRIIGLTPKAYALALRAGRVRKALAHSGTVTEAIYEAGYSSSSRFYTGSDRTLGMKPRHYQLGGAEETIQFAIAKCTLGKILVAASDIGVCAITLGDNPEELFHDLQGRFPRAKLTKAGRAFKSTVDQVIALVENPHDGLMLPLDIRGTAFQQRVWQALRTVPSGSTISYTQLAKRIGSPKAVRAVASACAANQLAVAVPCHRVLRNDGQLSGYRWGVARKHALLQKEKK